MLRVEVVKFFLISGRVGGLTGDHENMVGDTPYLQKVDCPTKPTDLELHLGSCISFHPQCPQMYSGDKKDVFQVSRRNH